jgi:hypothetical protein
MTFKRSSLALLAVATALISIGAQAEGKISIAQQFGIGYLILDVVRDQNLIEKHGKEQGLDIKVDAWVTWEPFLTSVQRQLPTRPGGPWRTARGWPATSATTSPARRTPRPTRTCCR